MPSKVQILPGPRISQHDLHDGDVEPAAELAADLAFDADQIEAARQRAGTATRRRPPRCGRSRLWNPESRAMSTSLVEEQPPDPADRCGRGARTRSPPRWCGRRPAPCTATATRNRRPRPLAPITIEDGHDRAERPGPGGQPRPLLGQRAGDEIERRGAGGDLAVVDRHDRFGVIGGRQSGGRVGHGRAMVSAASDRSSPGGNVTGGGTLPRRFAALPRSEIPPS